MQPIRALEKQLIRTMLLLLGISVSLALIARNLPSSFSTPIPVANFYDIVSEQSTNGIYFLGMYIVSLALLPAVITKMRLVVLDGIALTKRLLCALVFLAAFAFCSYLCVFMPATTTIGGGRFSVLLATSAKWSLAFGAIYGFLFYAAIFFLGASLAAIAGRRSLAACHT